jgi:[protein-PII] uridylyltransferase
VSLLQIAPQAAAGDRATFNRALADAHRRAREMIRSEHQAGADGLAVMAGLTRLLDELMETVCARAGEELAREGMRREGRFVLLALGSYGRRELAPHSDVDILFLVPQNVTPWVVSFTERVLYALWDLGLDVGYSTRSLRDCLHLATHNFDVLTSLLDARYLTGDGEIFRRFVPDLRRRVLSRVAEEFVRGKLEDMSSRVDRHGGSIHVLEPNVKEGMGGLRDIQAALWVAKVLFGCERLDDLVEQGLTDELGVRHLSRSRAFLQRVRCELHFASDTARDILTMDRQPFLAQRLGFRDKEAIPGVERFMQVYYTHCAQVRQLAESVTRRALERGRKVPRIIDRLREKDLGDGFFARDGAIFTREKPSVVFRRTPHALMRAFAVYQRNDLDLSPALALGIRRSLRLVDDVFRADPGIRALFFGIMARDQRLYETLLLMNELRFLGRYIPEFDRIHCKMQHDYYHTYTVDEHSIRAVRELIETTKGESAHHEPYRMAYRQAVEEGDRILMLLAVLLHDMGKGYGPGHAERGAQLADGIGRRLGLGREECDILVFLIRHHLAMAHIAQRRDLHDERTIAGFARLAGTTRRLRALFLITRADMMAVGPGVWNEWKSSLVAELYAEAGRALEAGGKRREQVEEKTGRRRGETARLMAGRQSAAWVEEELGRLSARAFLIYSPEKLARLLRLRAEAEEKGGFATAWRRDARHGYTEFHVVARDAPGLFARIAGVLTANAVNILAAQVYTREDGVVFDVLQVTDSVHRPIDDAVKQRLVSSELARAVAGEIEVDDLVRSRRLTLPLDRRDRSTGREADRVEVDNQASDRFTVIDVYASDRIGLLYTITSTLARLGLSIHNAKVSTKVDQAVDVFYVTDLSGGKLTDEEMLGKVREELLRALKGTAGTVPSPAAMDKENANDERAR